MSRAFRFLVAFLVLAAVAAPASAQSAAADGGFAIRAGATADPDQFHVGFHVSLGEIAPRLRFQPGAEIGFGSSRTTLVGNVDVLYLISASRTVQFLAGGGIGVGAQWRDGADSRGLFGGNLVGALEWGTRPTPDVPEATGSGLRYVFEVRFGIGDLPAFKATVALKF